MDIINFGNCQIDLDKIKGGDQDHVKFLFESAETKMGENKLISDMFEKLESPIEILFLAQWFRRHWYDIDDRILTFPMFYENCHSDKIWNLEEIVSRMNDEDSILYVTIEPQYIIKPYRLDFLFNVLKVERDGGICILIDVELDGGHHDSNLQKGKDWERNKFLELNQIETIRIKGVNLWKDPLNVMIKFDDKLVNLMRKWRGETVKITAQKG